MGKPFFSVIVPAHNSAVYILDCLSSVIRQTFTDYELIVVCDACTDGTENLVRTWTPAKVIVTNYGMDGLARNAGIDAAEGKWLLFLDDDDWWIHEYVLSEIHKVAERFGAAIDMITFDFIWKGVGYISTRADRMNIAVWSKVHWRDAVPGDRLHKRQAVHGCDLRETSAGVRAERVDVLLQFHAGREPDGTAQAGR